ncbi:Bug family tripartite tricarboxylate transporter substrate binding protein [Paraburkholderia youngii]|uniref:Bug family tripartite tricarboxylate transporter substrate binding protein n=1 Tax=Paraburkholderia youngii TaxID=2782701 RepID=UPI0028AA4C56|nr:tripartite tricarboxylate transporter substrate binding protein [Paraburkholderia youngii]
MTLNANRKIFVGAALAFAAVAGITMSSRGFAAQTAPVKASIAKAPAKSAPVKLIAAGPNQNSDLVARALAPALSKALGTDVVVENQADAAAVSAAKAAPADGLTLLVGDTDQVDGARQDLTPVAQVTGHAGLVLVAGNGAGLSGTDIKDYADLISRLKDNPNCYMFGSTGTTSREYLAMVAFQKRAGVKMIHTAYKSAAEQIPALLSGKVQMIEIPYEMAAPQIKAGKMRVLAVLGSRRIPEIQNVPALGEMFPGFDFASHTGVLAPKDLPAPVRDKIADAVKMAVQDPNVQKALNVNGHQAAYLASADYAKVIATDHDKLSQPAK